MSIANLMAKSIATKVKIEVNNTGKDEIIVFKKDYLSSSSEDVATFNELLQKYRKAHVTYINVNKDGYLSITAEL